MDGPTLAEPHLPGGEVHPLHRKGSSLSFWRVSRWGRSSEGRKGLRNLPWKWTVYSTVMYSIWSVDISGMDIDMNESEFNLMDVN